MYLKDTEQKNGSTGQQIIDQHTWGVLWIPNSHGSSLVPLFHGIADVRIVLGTQQQTESADW